MPVRLTGRCFVAGSIDTCTGVRCKCRPAGWHGHVQFSNLIGIAGRGQVRMINPAAILAAGLLTASHASSPVSLGWPRGWLAE